MPELYFPIYMYIKSNVRNAIAFYTVCGTIAIGIIGIAFKAKEASRAMSPEDTIAELPQDQVTCLTEGTTEDGETFFVSCGGFF